MKLMTVIAPMTAALLMSVSAQAVTVECHHVNDGSPVTFVGDVVSTTETDMTIQHEISGQFEVSAGVTKTQVLTAEGTLKILKAGKYYKDFDVNNFSAYGKNDEVRLYVSTSDDPALRTNREKNHIIVNGVDQGEFSCKLEK